MILDVRFPEFDGRLSAVAQQLLAISTMQEAQMQALDDLKAQVTANTSVLASAVALINGIAARIKAAGVDPAKLQELTDELAAKDAELSAAVVANTPPPAE